MELPKSIFETTDDVKRFVDLIKQISSSSSESNDEEYEKVVAELLSWSRIVDAIMINIISDEQNVRYGMEALNNQKEAECPTCYAGQYLNTAVGHYSLYSLETGDNNTSVGYSSQVSNKTGNGNISLGNWSLYYNVEGHHNIAIGYQTSLYLRTSYNIAVGKESLARVTSGGGYNIAIGILAGSNLTDGEKNIYIGDNTGVSIESYKMYIGNKVDGHSIIEADMQSKELKMNVNRLNASNIPTSSTGLVQGDIWNDNGTLKIVT